MYISPLRQTGAADHFFRQEASEEHVYYIPLPDVTLSLVRTVTSQHIKFKV